MKEVNEKKLVRRDMSRIPGRDCKGRNNLRVIRGIRN
jgi:hypothetical protein